MYTWGAGVHATAPFQIREPSTSLHVSVCCVSCACKVHRFLGPLRGRNKQVQPEFALRYASHEERSRPGTHRPPHDRDVLVQGA